MVDAESRKGEPRAKGHTGLESPLRDVDAVMLMHRVLLAEYAHVLQLTSQPTPRKRRRRRWWSNLSPLPRAYGARRLCEAHVKRRLALLASIYRQEALASSLDSERAAYETAADHSQAFSDTLTFWRLPTWLAVAPLLGAALGQMGGALGDVQLDDPVILAAISFYVLYLGGFAVVMILGAFRRKRTAFFPAWRSEERLRSRPVQDDPRDERNVYALEEELFDQLDRGRPLEQPLDHHVLTLAVAAVTFFATMGLFIAAASVKADASDIAIALGITLVVPYAVYALVLLLLLRKQHMRRWK